MDYASYEGKKITISEFLSQNSSMGERKALEKLKRFGEKGVLFCPFCLEGLILRAGEQRDNHFAHKKGRSCLISNTYDTYLQQSRRESKKHSVIREIIYDVLKTQEKTKKDLGVQYGYVAKAQDNWKHLPDIVLKTSSSEIAINIITNVHDIGDRTTVRNFINRDQFFRDKGMDVIWFVEERELADDMENRIIHLWEAEYNLAMKTDEGEVWDALLYELDNEPKGLFFDIMGYQPKGELEFDVRTLYYVHSLEDEIEFSVHRMILDEKSSPFRAFSLNNGYRLSLSSALTVTNTIQLSSNKQDELDRQAFREEYSRRKEEWDSTELTGMAYPVSPQPIAQHETVVGKDYPKDDVEPVSLCKKLRAFMIEPEEAKQLYRFIKHNRTSLPDYGLDVLAIKKLSKQALGAISNPKIREWLVEICEL